MKQLFLFAVLLAFFIYLVFSVKEIKRDPKVFTKGPARVESQVVLPKGEKLVNMWGDGTATNILTIDTVAVYHWRKISQYDGLSNETVIKESWQLNNPAYEPLAQQNNEDTTHSTTERKR